MDTSRPSPSADALINEARMSRAADKELVRRAFDFAKRAHEGHTRFSGEPYINHVFATAYTLARLKMDAPTIAAGLLHDIVEDTDTTSKELKSAFGEEVLYLVDSVTKLGKYKYKGLERHAESLRRFLLAVAQDVRVLIVKLADRLHNMRTLEYIRPEKQKRIALETLEVYAPIANRLGIGRIKGELEDLAFPYVYPKEYEETLELRKQKSAENQRHLEKAHRMLQEKLNEESIETIESDYRIKHIYSLYKKLKRYDMNIDRIHDIAALRIIVSTIGDCYRVLGIIHSIWKPLPGRIKDYIAIPKPNGYQSLHTTVFAGDGGIVEIQIRTREMHEEAEYGIAAHLAYKEGIRPPQNRKYGKKLAWLSELTEWQKSVSESNEFLKDLKMDFFQDRVFVFTPRGDVIDLPEGSTPIDFAYAIHSDIGHHAHGARVNNKYVSLDTALKNGDVVEIVTKETSKPSPKWLKYAQTTLARRHIRNALHKEGNGMTNFLKKSFKL